MTGSANSRKPSSTIRPRSWARKALDELHELVGAVGIAAAMARRSTTAGFMTTSPGGAARKDPNLVGIMGGRRRAGAIVFVLSRKRMCVACGFASLITTLPDATTSISLRRWSASSSSATGVPGVVLRRREAAFAGEAGRVARAQRQLPQVCILAAQLERGENAGNLSGVVISGMNREGPSVMRNVLLNRLPASWSWSLSRARTQRGCRAASPGSREVTTKHGPS